jgi:hypothetical protein
MVVLAPGPVERDPSHVARFSWCAVLHGARRRRRLFALGGLGLGLTLLIVIVARRHRGRCVRSTAPVMTGAEVSAPCGRPMVESNGPVVSVRETAVPLCEPDPESSFWADLAGRRLLRLSRDPRPLRTAVFVTGAVVIVAAAVIAAGTHFPSTTVLVRGSLAGPQKALISLAALVLGIACTAAAWILVLVGLFLTNWKVRIPGLLVLVTGAFAERYVLPQLSVFGTVLGIVALLGILVLGVLTVMAEMWAQRRTPKIDMTAPAWTGMIVVAVAVLVCAVFVGQAIRLARIGGLAVGSFSGLELLYVTIILIIPMLLLAGADIADMAREISDGLRHTMSLRSPAILPVVSAGVGVVGIAAAVRSLRTHIFAAVLLAALLIALIAVVAAVTRPYPDWKKSLPALAAAAAVFVFVLVIQIATGVQRVPTSSALMVSPPDKAFIHPSPPTFSIRYPSVCGSFSESTQAGVTAFVFIGCTPIRRGYSFGFLVANFSTHRYPGSSDPCTVSKLILGRNGPCVRESNAGVWRTTGFAQNGNRYIVWTRLIGNRVWLLMGQTSDQAVSYNFIESLLSAMRQSWRSTTVVAPAVTGRSSNGTDQSSAVIDHFGRRTSALWIGLAVVGIFFLVWRRRRSDRLNQALLYLVMTGVWVALIFFESSSMVFKKTGHLLPRLGIGGIEALAGLAALGCVMAFVLHHRPGADRASDEWIKQHRAIRGKLGSLLVLNCGLLLLWGMAILYGTAARVGTTVTIFQGVIVVLALAWEFFSSGEMLNSDRPRSLVPRSARVLMYLGYLVLTLSAVLQLGTLRAPATGMRVEVVSPETVVQIGIVGLGVPLVVVVFLVSWFQQAREPCIHTERSKLAAPIGRPGLVRAENLVHGSDQQGCGLGGQP